MLKLILTISMLTILFASCRSNKGQPDGGPCTYDTIPFKAVVVQINLISRNSKDSFYAVKIKINGQALPDTMLLSQLTRETQDKNFLDAHQIKIGKTLAGNAFFIKKGSCSPKYYKMDGMSF